jgi:hypothetical protein
MGTAVRPLDEYRAALFGGFSYLFRNITEKLIAIHGGREIRNRRRRHQDLLTNHLRTHKCRPLAVPITRCATSELSASTRAASRARKKWGQKIIFLEFIHFRKRVAARHPQSGFFKLSIANRADLVQAVNGFHDFRPQARLAFQFTSDLSLPRHS